jgi:2-oxoglutarate ferredoxin oxidoreductase subunit alpha
LAAVNQAREEGVKAGLFRLRTIWPFPESQVSELADQVNAIIVVEMNFGKLVKEVERVACGRAEVVSLGKVGGQLHLAREVLEAIKRAVP